MSLRISGYFPLDLILLPPDNSPARYGVDCSPRRANYPRYVGNARIFDLRFTFLRLAILWPATVTLNIHFMPKRSFLQ
jgi:hypothetical protein